MGTSVTSTGITFPDASTQTTAGGGYKMQVFTSSGTYTKTSGVKAIKVTVVGGGGGGGRHPYNSALWQAGGAGATAIKTFTDANTITSSTVPITVGSGGSNGNTSSGGSGGVSSFGSYCSGGGGAGAGMNTFADGGAASGGDLNIRGGSAGVVGGFGSYLQVGGASYLSSVNVKYGGEYGAGGCAPGVEYLDPGTDGGSGVVIVEEFF